MKIVFATHNQHKVEEIKAILPSSIEILSLTDIGCFEEIPETEETIEGNALLKATFVKEHYGNDCFADDTGLEVDFLKGAPGVHSARYAGEKKDDQANMNKLLEELNQTDQREAQFKTVIALVTEEGKEIFTGICKGNILHAARGTAGFGYDPIFQPNGKNQSFAEMTAEEKNKISHRARATRKLLDFLAQKTA